MHSSNYDIPHGSKLLDSLKHYGFLFFVFCFFFILVFKQIFSSRDSAHLVCDIVQLVEAKVIRHLLL